MNPHADSVQQPSDADILEIASRELGVELRPDLALWFARCILARFGTRPAAEPVLPAGWVPLTIEWDAGYPEEVAFGPQIMMDRLKKWLDKFYALRLAAEPSQSGSAGEAVYLVCTGEVYEGQETYTRHEGAPPPLSDYERLYAAPTPSDPQALLGWTRYEKARKLNVAQWAELHQRNLRDENFDDMIDALPATTQPVQQDEAPQTEDDLMRLADKLYAAYPAEKQAAPSGEDNHG